MTSPCTHTPISWTIWFIHSAMVEMYITMVDEDNPVTLASLNFRALLCVSLHLAQITFLLLAISCKLHIPHIRLWYDLFEGSTQSWVRSVWERENLLLLVVYLSARWLRSGREVYVYLIWRNLYDCTNTNHSHTHAPATNDQTTRKHTDTWVIAVCGVGPGELRY